ncbi:HlyD family secretion protein [Hymenobacter daecheongensis DSM 21074]|uniref:HlyD family secretion protein n=1 Tax=Hymenobacter daecheongensis DSM 21074 TaxID=1121955 RepID=A0A1M6EKK1_9BACT|nr:HlyD family efflux transporter periplasmic adaptor subunit [Hymenobacter daecheongensis]SHI86017.1 HlyD family secretion protein [Hymenobacter daecheongensis DSM 21074]
MTSTLVTHSDELEEIITSRPHWFIRIGTSLFFVLLAALLTLSYLVKFPTIVRCTFFMTSSNAPKSVVAKLNGRIVQILVRERQAVAPGQPLAYLESTANHAQVLKLAQYLDQLSQNHPSARLMPTDFQSVDFANQLGELQSRYQEFAQIRSQYHSTGAAAFFSKKQQLLEGELANLKRIEKNLTQQSELYSSDSQLAGKELAAQQQLATQGVIAPADVRREESRALAKQFPLKQAESARLNNISAQAAKEQELLELNKLVRDQAEAYLQSLNTLRSAVADWKSRFILSAPGAGKVYFSRFLEVNQVVRANEEVFFLGSTSTHYYGQMLVPQQNLGKVKVGQKVLIKLDGYPFKEYGLLNGKIATIAEMPTTDNNFLAKVVLPDGLRTTYGKKVVYRNRISATAEVITEETSLFDRIFYQLRASFGTLN